MILITGATGQVGSALVARLQAQRQPFRALAHTPASYARLSAQQVGAVLADDTQPATLATAFDDIDRLFLLTPGGIDQTATERRLVDAALQAGVRQIVKLSVFGAGEPSVSMLQTHYDIEQYIQQAGVAYTFLRPNLFMQNLGNQDAAQIKQRHAITNSVGDGMVSFIDTRDIAAVAAAALLDDQHAGQTYVLTGPEALSYATVAGKLTRLLGIPVQYVPLSDDAYRAVLLSVGLPAGRADSLAALYRFYRAGNAATVTDVVERITGQPARTLDQYLADHQTLFQ